MKKSYETLLPLLLIFAVSLVVLVIVFQNDRKESEQGLQFVQTAEIRKVIEPEEQAEMVAAQNLNDFVSRFYQRYPLLQKEVDPKNIKKVFSFDSGYQSQKDRSGLGWLVEVQNPDAVYDYSYYLVHQNLEKKLENVDSDTELQETEAMCEVEQFKITTDRRVPQEHIILSGSCHGEEDGMNFVSVYKISNGEKVKLYQNTSEPGIVSSTGNALGKLSDIKGVSNPILIVEYEVVNYLRSKLKSNYAVAFFDLKTGKLNQLIKID